MNVSIDKSAKLWKTASALAIFTIVYNVLEGVLSLYFGAEDEALTLAGFGADSFIEVISGLSILAMITRLHQQGDSKRGQFEQTALQITGVCFYVLVVGLIAGAAVSLWQHQHPETTVAGIVIALLSIAIMRVLATWKIRVGQQLNSPPIIADANCTMVCVYMSVILLASSLLYEFFRLPFIDAAGMLGLAWFAYREGKESFEKAKSATACCKSC